ncbi:MAG: iron-sulfur cluster assembly protein, partial [Opitutales bacterium]
MNPETIQAQLKTVKYPGFSRDIVSFGLVRDIQIKDANVHVTVELTTADPTIPEKIAADIKATLGAIEGCDAVEVQMEVNAPKQTAPSKGQGNVPTPNPLAGVKTCIAIASGKGG